MMRRELEEKLFAIEPTFFNRENIQVSLMAFGFECGDGWYPLVDMLIRQAKWNKDNPHNVPNPDYVEGTKLNIGDPATWRLREPKDCLPDDRAGWEQDPSRVTREQSKEDGIGCPFISDPRGVRDWLCVNGEKHYKDLLDREDEKWTYDQCPGCEGTNLYVSYRHQCERPWNHFRVVQVKEKFGGLRFYVEGGTKEYQGMIDMAESMSQRICEACGTWGTLEAKGYWNTLCHSCRSTKGNKALWELLDNGKPIFPNWDVDEKESQ